MDLSFRIDGVQKLLLNLDTLGRGVMESAGKALDLEAKTILEEAKRYYVPLDTGILASTGKKSPLVKSRTGRTVYIGFGHGGAEDYALAVHEHPSGHSPPSWQGKGVSDIKSVRSRTAWGLGKQRRGPKYLSRPLNRSVSTGRMMKRIGKAVGKAIKKVRA